MKVCTQYCCILQYDTRGPLSDRLGVVAWSAYSTDTYLNTILGLGGPLSDRLGSGSIKVCTQYRCILEYNTRGPLSGRLGSGSIMFCTQY